MATNVQRAYSSEGDSAVKETPYLDIERSAAAELHLRNTTVRNISWRGVTVTVKDRETKQQKVIVDNVEGYVEAGQYISGIFGWLFLPL